MKKHAHFQHALRRKSFRPDFRLTHHGSIALLEPTNKSANQWLRDTAPDDAQFMGSAMAIEPGYVQGVIEAANDAGLSVD